jgi:outer membrane assembly lipoprotein YfiO
MLNIYEIGLEKNKMENFIKKYHNSGRLGYFFAIIFLLFLLPHCAKEEKKVEDMNFEELKKKTLSALDLKKDELAIECLERLIAQNPDNQNIAEYKLMLADLYFNSGNLPSAYQLYEHYKEFYPSDQKAEFATYRAILSKFYQTLRIECDQRDTEQTMTLCDQYTANPTYQEYEKDVIDIRNTCQRKIIDKEVYVFNQYLKEGKKRSGNKREAKFDAARTRLKYLHDTYLEKDPTLQARLTFLECKLDQAEKKDEALKQKVEFLVDQYPNSHFTKMAQRLIGKDVLGFVF